MSSTVRSTDIHICPECGAGLVYPVTWSEAANDCWEIELRCPNCEWSERGLYRHEDVERFDHVLNMGTDRLIGDLELLQRVNFEEYIVRFEDALWEDHILPEDF